MERCTVGANTFYRTWELVSRSGRNGRVDIAIARLLGRLTSKDQLRDVAFIYVYFLLALVYCAFFFVRCTFSWGFLHSMGMHQTVIL